ncbi:DNA repair protein rad50 [Sphaceloma murrayae]|uniref:DNA repair protein rad50 n=1 Tax=Sphaceloma murrayae TaxID=2082308 RepID=A0A2K1QGZ3_9PEZI|nr:DNA repair protein rad50 [Sphaceloma murrayae]
MLKSASISQSGALYPVKQTTPAVHLTTVQNLRRPNKGLRDSSRTKRLRAGQKSEKARPSHPIDEDFRDKTRAYRDDVIHTANTAIKGIYNSLVDDLNGAQLRTPCGHSRTHLDFCTDLERELATATLSLNDVSIDHFIDPDVRDGTTPSNSTLGDLMQRFAETTAEKHERLASLMAEYQQLDMEIIALYDEIMIPFSVSPGADSVMNMPQWAYQDAHRLRDQVNELVATSTAAVKSEEKSEAEKQKLLVQTLRSVLLDQIG